MYICICQYNNMKTQQHNYKIDLDKAASLVTISLHIHNSYILPKQGNQGKVALLGFLSSNSTSVKWGIYKTLNIQPNPTVIA